MVRGYGLHRFAQLCATARGYVSHPAVTAFVSKSKLTFTVSVLLLTIQIRVHDVNLAFSGSNQAYRAISTSQLKALPLLHLWPIDVVVFHGPQGDLVLKGASRLDAFSGYPVRT